MRRSLKIETLAVGLGGVSKVKSCYCSHPLTFSDATLIDGIRAGA